MLGSLIELSLKYIFGFLVDVECKLNDFYNCFDLIIIWLFFLNVENFFGVIYVIFDNCVS